MDQPRIQVMKQKVRFIKEYITSYEFFSKRIFYIQNPWTKTWIYRNRTWHKRLKFTSHNNKLKNKFQKKRFSVTQQIWQAFCLKLCHQPYTTGQIISLHPQTEMMESHSKRFTFMKSAAFNPAGTLKLMSTFTLVFWSVILIIGT